VPPRRVWTTLHLASRQGRSAQAGEGTAPGAEAQLLLIPTRAKGGPWWPEGEGISQVISERLGHAGIAITMDLYAHLAPGLDEDAAAKVAGLIQ
jgi:hypothetical protein